jgi:hypothetical protein
MPSTENIIGIKMRNYRLDTNNELVRTWEEKGIVYFKALSGNFSIRIVRLLCEIRTRDL